MHLKEMKEKADKLASIGAANSEENQVVTSYSTLVTALEACVDDIRPYFAQQPLIHEEQNSKDKPSLLVKLAMNLPHSKWVIYDKNMITLYSQFECSNRIFQLFVSKHQLMCL